jgi:hypothetical protein
LGDSMHNHTDLHLIWNRNTVEYEHAGVNNADKRNIHTLIRCILYLCLELVRFNLVGN